MERPSFQLINRPKWSHIGGPLHYIEPSIFENPELKPLIDPLQEFVDGVPETIEHDVYAQITIDRESLIRYFSKQPDLPVPDFLKAHVDHIGQADLPPKLKEERAVAIFLERKLKEKTTDLRWSADYIIALFEQVSAGRLPGDKRRWAGIPIAPSNGLLGFPSSGTDPRGNSPALYTENGWAPFQNWEGHKNTSADIELWDTWPEANIGLRASLCPAFEIDCSVSRMAEDLIKLMLQSVGPAPIRELEGSARLLLPYRRHPASAPFESVRIVFRVPGVDQLQFVNCLAAGECYVIEGALPSGSRYKWHRSADLIEYIDKYGFSVMKHAPVPPGQVHRGRRPSWAA